MDETNFGSDKGPFSPGVLGVVVLAVLGATLVRHVLLSTWR